MATAQWIICERTGRWAAACRIQLQRVGNNPARWVRETRTRTECQLQLRQWPASLVAVEVTRADFSAWIHWIADLSQTFPAAVVVVLSELDSPEAGWALREAGALWIVGSPRALTPVTDLAQRHLARASDPWPDVAVWAQVALPWTD